MGADQDWAALMEQRIHGPAYSIGRAGSETMSPERVHLLRYGSGDTETFRSTLLHGPHFSFCRNALEQAGHALEHSSGALLFIKPAQADDVLRELDAIEVHPFHIVITESLEYLLSEILLQMPCRRRPREKVRSRREIAVASSGKQGYSDGLEGEADAGTIDTNNGDVLQVIAKRTFLCVAPQLRESHTVIQSTTEAQTAQSQSHYSHFRGINPRRLV